ncbi:MAG: ABC-F family ATP-binding cassette domain-containing protein [Carbonactinosporaceae bacterium]
MTRHLVSYPAARRAALVVVTHDRSLLDTVCTQTWEVHGGQVHAYNGGYSSYVLAKAERARLAEAVEQRRRNLLRKELAWLRRGPPARTSKPRFRIEAANTLIAGEPPPRDAAELVRFASARLGKTVYELHDTTLRRGERTVLDRMTWQLGPGDRIGLVGVNGSGKTSVLRMLHGELPPSAGRLVTGKTVRPAYLPQETSASQAGEADRSLRALEAVQAVRRTARLGKGQEFSATQLLERFGFTGERQRTRVGDLSGGERRRLQLLRLLMTEPNVLLLDEPTNDLDVETLTVLEDLLDGWPGSLVVVSHDRYFLERVCDRVVALLGDGRLRLLPGGVAEYLERRRATGAAAPHAPPAPRRPGDTRAAQRETRKELTRLERRLDTLAQREKRLHEEMAEHATDPGRLAELDAGLRALLADKHRVEERWLALAEQEDPS